MLITLPGGFSAPEAPSLWSVSSNRRLDKKQKTSSHETMAPQRRKISVGNLERAVCFMDEPHEILNISTLVTCLSVTQLMFLMDVERFHFDVRFSHSDLLSCNPGIPSPTQAAIAWIQPNEALSSSPSPICLLIKRKLDEFSYTWSVVFIQQAAQATDR